MWSNGYSNGGNSIRIVECPDYLSRTSRGKREGLSASAALVTKIDRIGERYTRSMCFKLIGPVDSGISYTNTLVLSFSAMALRERIFGCSIRMIKQLLPISDGAGWLNMIALKIMRSAVDR